MEGSKIGQREKLSCFTGSANGSIDCMGALELERPFSVGPS